MAEYLTYSRTVELLRGVVAEKGADYVYPHGEPLAVRRPDEITLVYVSCFYVRDGAPSCIVAQVLHRAGVPVEDLVALEGVAPADDVDGPFAEWAEWPARRLLAAVQRHQDDGHPWGEALTMALEAGDRGD